MKNIITAGVVGFLFSLGLGISGMTDPRKIIGFLDVFGAWNPALMFVMVGAIAVHIVAYPLVRKKAHPLFDKQWHVPSRNDITPSLLIGAVIFGMGWGLAGYCPGPAIVSLAKFQSQSLLFVGSMVGGMFLFKILDQKFKIKR